MSPLASVWLRVGRHEDAVDTKRLRIIRSVDPIADALSRMSVRTTSDLSRSLVLTALLCGYCYADMVCPKTLECACISSAMKNCLQRTKALSAFFGRSLVRLALRPFFRICTVD